ncbi:MAG: hypothetical protein IT318_22780 [Anaerolineales bacterium]|nr:hypothetical protein [Anaerolineales bacterium]
MNATLSTTSRANAKSEARATTPGLSLALLLAGTLLLAFSMGRWLAPLAAWVGPVLILRYSRDHKGWRSHLVLLVAYIVAFAIGFGPMWLGAGWPLPMVAVLPVFYGLMWSLPYLADGLVGARLAGFARTLVYPLAATTLEFVNIHTNPVGMWGATGFTQYGNLPFMQLASVTGMIGITFLMGWFAAVANWAWENRSNGSLLLRGLAAFGATLAVVFGFGFLRLNAAAAGETVRVAGITAMSQPTVGKRVFEAPDPATARQELQAYWDAYFEETVREAQAGAQIVVWDEAVGVSGSRFGADEAL